MGLIISDPMLRKKVRMPIVQKITNEEPLSYWNEYQAAIAEGDFDRIDNGF